MPPQDLARWTHSHSFDSGNRAAERGTMLVMWITLTMMVIEISAGWWFNSMALLADGWHMASHAMAIGLSAFAYVAARRYASDARFAFGTFKIEVLAGFASSLLLLVIAVLMIVGSVERILWPEDIRYQEAIAVAVLGLVVNVVCAVVLGKAHDHGHGHGHGHAHDHAHGDAGHKHHDLNLRAAYLHVIADAATSVLAIIALSGGWLFGWAWLDPVMGIVGAILISIWARGLILQTGKVLLDREMDVSLVRSISDTLESTSSAGDTRVVDLHVWRVGKNAYACALSLVTDDPALTAGRVHEQLAEHREIAHATVEIHLRPATQ